MGHIPAIAIPEGNPEDHLAAGTWTRADSLVALADEIGVPGDALVSTVERFNGFAEAGDDEDFDRGKDEFATYFASPRSEEHTSELQSLMRISYAVFCLK